MLWDLFLVNCKMPTICNLICGIVIFQLQMRFPCIKARTLFSFPHQLRMRFSSERNQIKVLSKAHKLALSEFKSHEHSRDWLERRESLQKVPNQKTLMNFSHLWTSHGFNLLLNCLFEYSHLNAETLLWKKTYTGAEIIERLIISFETGRAKSNFYWSIGKKIFSPLLFFDGALKQIKKIFELLRAQIVGKAQKNALTMFCGDRGKEKQWSYSVLMFVFRRRFEAFVGGVLNNWECWFRGKDNESYREKKRIERDLMGIELEKRREFDKLSII